MKILQITSKEKIALIAVFLIDFLSKLLAKILEVGESTSQVMFGIFRDLPMWAVYVFEISVLLIFWIVRKTKPVGKIARIGFVLSISGLLNIVVWRILFGSIFLWISISLIPVFSLSEVSILFGIALIFINFIWDQIE